MPINDSEYRRRVMGKLREQMVSGEKVRFMEFRSGNNRLRILPVMDIYPEQTHWLEVPVHQSIWNKGGTRRTLFICNEYIGQKCAICETAKHLKKKMQKNPNEAGRYLEQIKGFKPAKRFYSLAWDYNDDQHPIKAMAYSHKQSMFLATQMATDFGDFTDLKNGCDINWVQVKDSGNTSYAPKMLEAGPFKGCPHDQIPAVDLRDAILFIHPEDQAKWLKGEIEDLFSDSFICRHCSLAQWCKAVNDNRLPFASDVKRVNDMLAKKGVDIWEYIEDFNEMSAADDRMDDAQEYDDSTTQEPHGETEAEAPQDRHDEDAEASQEAQADDTNEGNQEADDEDASEDEQEDSAGSDGGDEESGAQEAGEEDDRDGSGDAPADESAGESGKLEILKAIAADKEKFDEMAQTTDDDGMFCFSDPEYHDAESQTDDDGEPNVCLTCEFLPMCALYVSGEVKVGEPVKLPETRRKPPRRKPAGKPKSDGESKKPAASDLQKRMIERASK